MYASGEGDVDALKSSQVKYNSPRQFALKVLIEAGANINLSDKVNAHRAPSRGRKDLRKRVAAFFSVLTDVRLRAVL
jgi:hypothetical protein